MAEQEHLTGIKKRQQISGTRKQVFIWVAAASAAVVICIIVGINLIQRISYQTNVNGELGKTAKTLENSVDAIDPLIKNIDNLRTNRQLTLTNLKNDDSTVFQVVIDALPTEDDAGDLSTSLQSEILQIIPVKRNFEANRQLFVMQNNNLSKAIQSLSSS